MRTLSLILYSWVTALLTLGGLVAMPEAIAGAIPSFKPQRIVSLNLCTDQLLLQLVDRSRIAAVTYLARDPQAAALYEQAEGLRVVRGNAEEVLALQPDLVLVGLYTTRHTTALLRRFGIPVVVVPGANTLSEMEQELRLVAEAVGEGHRGAELWAAYEARRLKSVNGNAPKIVTMRYSAGGFSSGSGTLIDTIINASGQINAAARAGMQGSQRLPLEKLMEQSPHILIGSDYQRRSPTQDNRLLGHPAITALNAQHIIFKGRDTVCAGIWNLDAADQLRALESK